jgi:hypothetical protein
MAIILLLLTAVVPASSGCGTLREIHDAVYGDYHRLSPATLGVYITFKRHATDGMVAFFTACKNDGHSDSVCGTETLRASRDQIEPMLRGRARELWNGQYSVFGYHPHIGKGFRDEEGPDFATAVRDMRARGHECLRIHWKATGTNWTTVNDEGIAECSWGAELNAAAASTAAIEEEEE